MKFTGEQNETWKILFNRQVENIKKFACEEFITGFENLKLSGSRIPSLLEINRRLMPATGWKAVRTPVRYLSDKQWAKHMARREFPITNFIRGRKELDFTPEPDLFHDIFGHLPLLMNPEVAELIEIFSEEYRRADKKKLRRVSQLWWNTVEFGLIRENREIKAFGAGLMSSFGEIQKLKPGGAKVVQFSIQRGIQQPRAVASFHTEYLVIESVSELIEDLKGFFAIHGTGGGKK
ncbi:MAG: hypothetical protein HY051_06160 [Candidatus Aenigmarchaeota archaeon]|nr:hypothetical protein [Candidatus Aenigmarchaeota archaeon]